MNTAELRRMAEAVLLLEKESAKWAAGIPDSQEREAVEHGVRLATAIIQFRDAARNPKDVLSFLDRLDAACRCGSCKWWDVHDRRCYNSKSPLLKELCVLRFQACGEWEDLRELFKQRDNE